jgi:hypothetical protein
MASTVTASTMTVSISESINLNGKNQGATNTLSIGSINEVTNRIVTIPTSEVTVCSFGAAVSSGTYVAAGIRYIRLTNKDDSNYVTLNIEGASRPVSGSGTITLLETTGDTGTAVAAGKFIVGDMKYLRITNLNSAASEGVKLQIVRDDNSDATDDECAWFLLEEGKSFILNTFDAAFDAAAGDLDSPTLDAITDIRALNESGSVAVDLEIFIASA